MRDHYHGQAAAQYDRTWSTFTQRMLLPVRNQILEHVSPSAQVLDIGCGTGRLLTWLAETRPDLHLWGTDESTAMFAPTARRLGDRAHFLRWDLDQPSPTAIDDAKPFAIVVCTSVLHYVHNPEQVIAQASRLLTSDGMLIVADFIRHGWWWPAFEGFLHVADKTHQKTLTATSIAQLLTQASLTLTHSQVIAAGGPWQGFLVTASASANVRD